MIWTVPPLWQDSACWILGGGTSVPKQFGVPQQVIQKVYAGSLFPAVYSDYLAPIHNAHVIGINNAYQVGTWIDILFFGDSHWHLLHQRKLAMWPGLKVCCDQKFANRPIKKMEGIKFLERDKDHRQGITTNPSKVSWNANSGAAAISLAYHLGVKKIYLLGFDMTMDARAEYSHWHGSHLPPGKKRKDLPPFSKHMKGFSKIAEDARELGVEIFLIGKDSAIETLPKVFLKDVL